MTNVEMTPAQPSNKRVRISDQVEVRVINDTISTTETAPSQAARATVETAVASYPEAIRIIALGSSKTFNGLKNKIRTQVQKIDRFDDEHEIPKSAKINFKLTAPPDVMETDEFKSQATLMEAAVETFHKAALQSIVKIADLRLNSDKLKVTSNLTATIRQVCELILLEQNPTSTDPPVSKFAWFVTGKLDGKIFENTFTTRTHIRNELKRNIDDDTGSTGDSAIVFEAGLNAQFDELEKRVTPIVKAIFVDSWNAQELNLRNKQINIALAKKAKEMQMEKAAEATQMEIDDETPVSAGRIAELIKEAVQKETKQQQTEMNKLREMLHRSKNFSRGAESSSKISAPLKKKQKQKQSNQKGKEKQDQQPPQQKKKEKERGTSPVPKGKGSPKGKETSSRPSGQRKKNTKSNNTRPQKSQR
jgi:hypothetical protein